MNIQVFSCILVQEPFDYNWTSNMFCLQGNNEKIEKLNQVDFILK